MFVVNFNDEQYLDQDFTNNLLKLKEALDKIDARGGTALYDAVVASAEHLKQNGRLEKKVLFVVTDGEDNASSETLERAVKQLQQENSPTIYAIGILQMQASTPRQRRLSDSMRAHRGHRFLPEDAGRGGCDQPHHRQRYSQPIRHRLQAHYSERRGADFDRCEIMPKPKATAS